MSDNDSVVLKRKTPPSGAGHDLFGRALKDVLQTYEIRVVGVMGILVGYICIFLVKLLQFEDVKIGVGLISFISMIFMISEKTFNFRSLSSYLRVVLVVVLSNIACSPQLFYAWETSIAERAREIKMRQLEAAVIENSLVVDRTKISIVNGVK